MAVKIVLGLLSLLFTIATFLPVVKSDYWTFRILEYPRLQKLVIGIALAVAIFLTREVTEDLFWWMLVLILLSIGYLVIKIFPYTPVAPKEMKRVRGGSKDSEIRIFTANVLQDNRAYDKMLAQINRQDPDVIFLVETDDGWEHAMKKLEEQ